MASSSVLITPWIAARTNGVVSKGTTVFEPGGKDGASSFERGLDRARGGERVGAGRERDGDAGGRAGR